MDVRLFFRLSVALSFVTWSLVARYYFWPALSAQPGRSGFRPILLLHSSRFVGLTFLVPGVVSADSPPLFAKPAAYGDLIAALLAFTTLPLLDRRMGPVFLWAFNLWGTGDLVFAFYQG
jgi:hypothetical protein